MPLVAHTHLPTYDRLSQEGVTVVARASAEQQDIRELHIGLLNLMPDAALEATERQFYRLVGEANQIAQFYVHPFTLTELPRGAAARRHIAAHYESFEELQSQGLDALIVTGANALHRDLREEPFWGPLTRVFDWAAEQVTSTLCSCLATHALMQYRTGFVRRPLGVKRWGVFEHTVCRRQHPLVAGVNTRFDVPHSRFNDVPASVFADAGCTVLASSEHGEVHLATSADGIRQVFFQGHPEYDVISLLKEYRREVAAWLTGTREDYPPFPERYFSPRSRAVLTEYRERLRRDGDAPAQLDAFPTRLVTGALHNTWHDTAEAIMNNWVGLVYRVTHIDRRRAFADGVDPADPLALAGIAGAGERLNDEASAG